MSESRDPDLRQLRTLVAVAREGSFSRAAELLGYTQSAVSQQIARLEGTVGQALLYRPHGSAPVTATAAGRILLGHAEAITARLASARADLAALADGTAGVLRIGSYQSVGVRILPGLLRGFREGWPRVDVELTEVEDDGELLRAVEGGELDLTFIAYPLPPGPFEHAELMVDPYVVAAREGDGLGAGRGPVALSDLAGVPLVTYSHMRAVHAIENRLGRLELAQQVVLRSNDNGTILGLAAEGVGVAVVSWLSVDPRRPGIRIRALAGVPPRVVGIAWHRDRYRIPAAEAFVRLARRESLREHRLAEDVLG